MAKIIEDVIIVKFSKIVKDDDADSAAIANQDIQNTLEQVAQELVGESVIVEAERP